MIKNINSIACLVFTLLISSCKDGGCNIVLNSVNFKTTLSPDQASAVKVPNGWSYTEGGNCGIIVYNTGEQIVAYDRCSQMSNGKIIAQGFQAIDQQSGSKWLLRDGSPTHLSECSLRRFQAVSSGELIIITN